MNKLFEIPAKKTQKKEIISNERPVKIGRGTTDTGDPTSPSPLTTTHVFRQMR